MFICKKKTSTESVWNTIYEHQISWIFTVNHLTSTQVLPSHITIRHALGPLHLDVDSIEFIEAAPGTTGCQTFEELSHLSWWHRSVCISNTKLTQQVGVSKNNGIPKSSILIGFSIIFTIHFGVPLFLETPKCITIDPCKYLSKISIGFVNWRNSSQFLLRGWLLNFWMFNVVKRSDFDV